MITYLFKQSLAMPPEWKSAYIAPIFKKDKRCVPLNYWPVSLTSIYVTFEHILAIDGNQLNIMSNNYSLPTGILDFSKAFDKADGPG